MKLYLKKNINRKVDHFEIYIWRYTIYIIYIFVCLGGMKASKMLLDSQDCGDRREGDRLDAI